MAKIKPLAEISSKWATVTPARQDEYRKGVENPKEDWATATKKAAPTYAAAIQASLANKSFEKGITKSGTDNWKNKTLTKGPGRWAEGVAVSQSDYETGFAPFREVIAGITLPPRGPKGDPKNIQRVAVIAKALHDKKVGG